MDTQLYKAMQDEVQAFNQKAGYTVQSAKPRQPSVSKKTYEKDVIVVKLIVRRQPLADDQTYFHITDRLSSVEAEIDARKAAKAEGYPFYQNTVYVKRGVTQNPKIVAKH